MKLKNIMLAGAMAIALTGTAQAQVAVPNTFADGQPAVAAEVNANFSALATAINDLADRVTALESGAGDTGSTGVPGVYRIVSTQTELFGQNMVEAGYAELNGYVLTGRLVMNSGGTWSLEGNEFEHRLAGIGDVQFDVDPDTQNVTRFGSQELLIQMSPLAVNLSGTWAQGGDGNRTVTLSIGEDEILDFRTSVTGEIMLAPNLARENEGGFQGGQAGVVIAIKLSNQP
ncbi:hypothetical protein Tgr7_3039 [Thioalkalivibrio sulfidiphilus HL-EbGr7]|uniref:Uncharacterized protein n=1 Tax=Thioalkalivibrio sulfidiphilus (strain HL-EbGR7) TaxID=396588 RepID=B8GPW1_THISH|nr:hypothetical protein [Thioalkalivibrio sulfidiphilus]ACL74108.1 hypothetical protein Tgr7_3039 [Thioalkalivibrio sulfidiphilus HL-EbGr7]